MGILNRKKRYFAIFFVTTYLFLFEGFDNVTYNSIGIRYMFIEYTTAEINKNIINALTKNVIESMRRHRGNISIGR